MVGGRKIGRVFDAEWRDLWDSERRGESRLLVPSSAPDGTIIFINRPELVTGRQTHSFYAREEDLGSLGRWRRSTPSSSLPINGPRGVVAAAGPGTDACSCFCTETSFIVAIHLSAPASSGRSMSEVADFGREMPLRSIDQRTHPLCRHHFRAERETNLLRRVSLFAANSSAMTAIETVPALSWRYLGRGSRIFTRWKYVAYVTFPDGILWRANRDGTNVMQLTEPSASHPSMTTWSPDGTQIMYVRVVPTGQNLAYVVPSHGGSSKPLLSDPTLSSPGCQLVA